MKAYVNKIATNPLVAGSTFIFGGTLLANVFNFIFNFYMSRNLSVADYGILASIISFITLPSLAAGAVTPLVVNFAATYFAKHELDKAKALFIYLYKIIFGISSIIVIGLLLVTSVIATFFHIADKQLIILADIVIFSSFFSLVNISFLQAKLEFKFLSINSLLAAVIKAGIGVLLVMAGFSVYGGVVAILLAYVIPYLLSFGRLGFVFSAPMSKLHVTTKEVVVYGIPSALAILGLTSFITTDIMLAKHFFSEQQAGVYAGLSLIGRVIFFFSAPIGTVMFPLVVQRHARTEAYKHLLYMSLGLVLCMSLAVTIFYFLFPVFTITFFLKKPEYLVAVPYVGYFGLFITMYSLLSIMINFYLSIKKTVIWIPVVLAAITQAVAIWFFHASILMIVMISLLTSFLLLTGLLLYYLYATSHHE